ncbi:glycosyltransferase, group 1 family [Tolypothrix sp. PCC 7601]|nr:glycosyltransferase, group 1 family [Tolypothrix sp. PCC 7601]BAY92333.1 group 1 glycosyl transferase [Microchaete diplosiphon NIES-3275]
MKICIVTHKLKKGDGQGRVNYEVAKEVICRGHQLTLLASEVAPELQNHSLVNWVEIPVQQFPTEFIRNLVFAKKSADWLNKHRAEFDLVKVNGAITTTSADVNAVHFVHSSWLRSPVHISRTRRDAYGLYQWLYTALNAQWEKQAFQQAKVVVAVSEKVAQELVNIGVPRSQIQVIVNGVDLTEFTPGISSRQTWNLPENVPLALFAGDIRTTRKNLDTVLYALAKVPDLHLAVVGDTEGSPFPQLAASLGLSERVHFLGYRRDMSAIMRAVDLFVFPSRYEACTLVLLEALASGLPVITATATGGAELVTPECGVVLSNTDDIEALAAALSSLICDRPLMQQMGKAARSLAEQHSWMTMAQNYVDLFEDLKENSTFLGMGHGALGMGKSFFAPQGRVAISKHPQEDPFSCRLSMKNTVLIPTYRRPLDLSRCLLALQAQTKPVDQVIVVVRDTDQETWQFLADFPTDKLPLQTVTVSVPGVVAALNAGLAVVEGDIVSITDDDAAPHTDWLEKINAHFEADNRIAGVGGRDWIYQRNKLEDGSQQVVGKLQWFGRVIGNHHLGVGEAREVDVLKGVNMSFRHAAIAQLHFDERMRGTGAQVHFEMAFTFALKRAGWKLIYDPQIAVDHYPAQRFDEDQRHNFNEIAFINLVHNETLVLLDHLPPLRRAVFLLWAIFIGTRDSLGFVQWLRFLPIQGQLAGKKFLASLRGRWLGWQTHKQFKIQNPNFKSKFVVF